MTGISRGCDAPVLRKHPPSQTLILIAHLPFYTLLSLRSSMPLGGGPPCPLHHAVFMLPPTAANPKDEGGGHVEAETLQVHRQWV